MAKNLFEIFGCIERISNEKLGSCINIGSRCVQVFPLDEMIVGTAKYVRPSEGPLSAK